jgi:hypothetical protein
MANLKWINPDRFYTYPELGCTPPTTPEKASTHVTDNAHSNIVPQPHEILSQMLRNTSLLLEYVGDHGYKRLEQLLGPLDDHRLISWCEYVVSALDGDQMLRDLALMGIKNVIDQWLVLRSAGPLQRATETEWYRFTVLSARRRIQTAGSIIRQPNPGGLLDPVRRMETCLNKLA